TRVRGEAKREHDRSEAACFVLPIFHANASATVLEQFPKIVTLFPVLCGFFGFEIAALVLRIDIDVELGHTERLRLSTGRALEGVMNEDECRLPRFREKDSVAHGAGGAGPSGADPDQYVVAFVEQSKRVDSRRRRPCIRFVDSRNF